MQHVQEIGGGESETDIGYVLLDQFLRVDADDVPARVYQRTTTVARIDRRVRLDPRAGASAFEFANGADDAFGDAEKHRVAGIADGEDTFALLNERRVGQSEMREIIAGYLQQRYVELGV